MHGFSKPRNKVGVLTREIKLILKRVNALNSGNNYCVCWTIDDTVRN